MISRGRCTITYWIARKALTSNSPIYQWMTVKRFFTPLPIKKPIARESSKVLKIKDSKGDYSVKIKLNT